MNFVELSAEDFRAFAATSPYRSFMQTPEIAHYRETKGWTPYYLGVRTDTGALKAATMLVARPTFLGKSTFLAPGGPLLDLEDAPLAHFFLTHLKKYVKSHNGYVLHLSPYYELIERDRSGAPVENGFNHQSALAILRTHGFRPIPSTQPKYMFAVDLTKFSSEDVLFASFKSNTRGHIRKAEKDGVKIRTLKREELSVFMHITKSTATRRDFTDQPLSYYEAMYDLFVPRGEAQFLVAEADVDGHPTPLSAAMFMTVGFEVVYLFSGSDEQYMKDYNAQYLIQWHMLKYALSHHFKRYNFYGIHALPTPNTKDGIYDFKKGFSNDISGHVLEFIGTYECSASQPFYALHRLLSRLKK